MNLLSKRKEACKQQQMDELLTILYQTPEHLSAETLKETTALGSVALPLLARLQKRGLLEPQWTQTLSGSELGYRLSAAGRDYVEREVVNRTKVPLARVPSVAKPLFNRLSALWSRTGAR